jgi:catechol 2,3-dioxygenase-like lactoylglutathione lyase family enzyme
MNVLSFDHVHVYAADPERSIAFYTGHFGAERVGGTTNADGDENHFLVLGGQLLVVSVAPRVLLERARERGADDGAPAGPYGLAHIGFNVADVDATLAGLAAAGVEVLQPARASGLIRYAYVGGPDGVAIELTQYVLPPRLRPLAPVLAGYNRAVHAIRRQLLRTAVGKPRATRAA